MASINEYYLNLQGTFLFTEIARRMNEYKEMYPDHDVIKLGIGDVTRPLAPVIVDAMHKALDELASSKTFRGYGPELGYNFLIDAIIEKDYKKLGIDFEHHEIFISDGAKHDSANIQEIFGPHNIIALTDPVYPVYLDSNVMAGRSGKFINGAFEKVVYLPCTEENNFVPQIPNEHIDMVYLCCPNNPTGTYLTYDELKAWVDYCRENDVVLFYDSAYEAFITNGETPHSIYEIEGAKEVAIEFRSFSKTAGFTGTRLAYAVVPKEVTGVAQDGKRYPLNPLWTRRQTTKYNGAPYIIQRGAEAALSEEGQKQIKEDIAYYMENARIIREGLEKIGIKAHGGVNSPYIWFKVPDKMTSWDFFDVLLNEVQVVGTPGSGFGPAGEGYFRLSAFGSREMTHEAVSRLSKLNFK